MNGDIRRGGVRRLFVVAAFVFFPVIAGAQDESSIRWGSGWSLRSTEKTKEASGPTPRTTNGNPDFSGYWGRLKRDANPTEAGIGAGGTGSVEGWVERIEHFEKDAQIAMRAYSSANRPIYKPEYWEKIRQLDWDYSRKKDPASHCLPGVPRLGAPNRIVQLANEVIFFYESINRFRTIPTDNRPHDPMKVSVPTWFGDSVGHWEGDTLVIDTIGLTDASWLSPTGNIHSDKMRVTERVHRDGDMLFIETTVDDPMLLQPWQMNPIAVKRNADPKAVLWEDAPCDERDQTFEGDPNDGR